MNFGLSPDQYDLLKRLVFAPLLERHAQVYVFGSRARGTHHPYSDIDILFIEDPNFPISSQDLAAIREAAEDSNLPIKVELVNNSYLAASYRESVERDKVPVS